MKKTYEHKTYYLIALMCCIIVGSLILHGCMGGGTTSTAEQQINAIRNARLTIKTLPATPVNVNTAITFMAAINNIPIDTYTNIQYTYSTEWDFGDQTPWSGPGGARIQKEYTRAGEYTVKLTLYIQYQNQIIVKEASKTITIQTTTPTTRSTTEIASEGTIEGSSTLITSTGHGVSTTATEVILVASTSRAATCTYSVCNSGQHTCSNPGTMQSDPGQRTAHTATITGLTPNTQYTYRITCTADDNREQATVETSFTPQATPTPTPSPTVSPTSSPTSSPTVTATETPPPATPSPSPPTGTITPAVATTPESTITLASNDVIRWDNTISGILKITPQNGYKVILEPGTQYIEINEQGQAVQPTPGATPSQINPLQPAASDALGAAKGGIKIVQQPPTSPSPEQAIYKYSQGPMITDTIPPQGGIYLVSNRIGTDQNTHICVIIDLRESKITKNEHFTSISLGKGIRAEYKVPELTATSLEEAVAFLTARTTLKCDNAAPANDQNNKKELGFQIINEKIKEFDAGNVKSESVNPLEKKNGEEIISKGLLGSSAKTEEIQSYITAQTELCEKAINSILTKPGDAKDKGRLVITIPKNKEFLMNEKGELVINEKTEFSIGAPSLSILDKETTKRFGLPGETAYICKQGIKSADEKTQYLKEPATYSYDTKKNAAKVMLTEFFIKEGMFNNFIKLSNAYYFPHHRQENTFSYLFECENPKSVLAMQQGSNKLEIPCTIGTQILNELPRPKNLLIGLHTFAQEKTLSATYTIESFVPLDLAHSALTRTAPKDMNELLKQTPEKGFTQLAFLTFTTPTSTPAPAFNLPINSINITDQSELSVFSLILNYTETPITGTTTMPATGTTSTPSPSPTGTTPTPAEATTSPTPTKTIGDEKCKEQKGECTADASSGDCLFLDGRMGSIKKGLCTGTFSSKYCCTPTAPPQPTPSNVGKLEIKTDKSCNDALPLKATIYINGKPIFLGRITTKKGTIIKNKIPEGKHTLVVQNQNGIKTPVEIKSEKPAIITVNCANKAPSKLTSAAIAITGMIPAQQHIRPEHTGTLAPEGTTQPAPAPAQTNTPTTPHPITQKHFNYNQERTLLYYTESMDRSQAEYKITQKPDPIRAMLNMRAYAKTTPAGGGPPEQRYAYTLSIQYAQSSTTEPSSIKETISENTIIISELKAQERAAVAPYTLARIPIYPDATTTQSNGEIDITSKPEKKGAQQAASLTLDANANFLSAQVPNPAIQLLRMCGKNHDYYYIIMASQPITITAIDAPQNKDATIEIAKKCEGTGANSKRLIKIHADRIKNGEEIKIIKGIELTGQPMVVIRPETNKAQNIRADAKGIRIDIVKGEEVVQGEEPQEEKEEEEEETKKTGIAPSTTTKKKTKTTTHSKGNKDVKVKTKNTPGEEKEKKKKDETGATGTKPIIVTNRAKIPKKAELFDTKSSVIRISQTCQDAIFLKKTTTKRVTRYYKEAGKHYQWTTEETSIERINCNRIYKSGGACKNKECVSTKKELPKTSKLKSQVGTFCKAAGKAGRCDTSCYTYETPVTNANICGGSLACCIPKKETRKEKSKTTGCSGNQIVTSIRYTNGEQSVIKGRDCAKTKGCFCKEGACKKYVTRTSTKRGEEISSKVLSDC